MIADDVEYIIAIGPLQRQIADAGRIRLQELQSAAKRRGFLQRNPAGGSNGEHIGSNRRGRGAEDQIVTSGGSRIRKRQDAVAADADYLQSQQLGSRLLIDTNASR